MKLLFENTTIYTPKSYKEFLRFHNNKYGNIHIIFTFLFSVLFLYCSIMNIIQNNIGISLFYIAIFIVFLIYRIYVPIYKFKKTLMSQKDKKENTFRFKFYDKYFTVNDIKIYYIELHKIFETKNFYYLYLNTEKAALVNKNGFKIGNPNDFSEFIKKKGIFKYKKI